jgi:hypothetical protein
MVVGAMAIAVAPLVAGEIEVGDRRRIRVVRIEVTHRIVSR